MARQAQTVPTAARCRAAPCLAAAHPKAGSRRVLLARVGKAAAAGEDSPPQNTLTMMAVVRRTAALSPSPLTGPVYDVGGGAATRARFGRGGCSSRSPRGPASVNWPLPDRPAAMPPVRLPKSGGERQAAGRQPGRPPTSGPAPASTRNRRAGTRRVRRRARPAAARGGGAVRGRGTAASAPAVTGMVPPACRGSGLKVIVLGRVVERLTPQGEDGTGRALTGGAKPPVLGTAAGLSATAGSVVTVWSAVISCIERGTRRDDLAARRHTEVQAAPPGISAFRRTYGCHAAGVRSV